MGECAVFPPRSSRPDFCRLGKRADGGRREKQQLELLALEPLAQRERGVPIRIGGSDRREPCLDGGVVNPHAVTAAGVGGAVFRERG